MTALNPAFASPSSRPLPVWFGYALAVGDRVLSTVTAPSSTGPGGALYGDYILGEGEADGLEMMSPQQQSHLQNGFFGGVTRAQYFTGITATVHFHAGRYTIKGAGNQLTSIGDDQQYDSFFANFPSVAPPQSHSGMAYFVLGIPPVDLATIGVGTPFPLQPMGIWRGLRCRIFDTFGNVIGYGFTTNPAWHFVESILRYKIKPQQPALAGLTAAEKNCFVWPSIVATAARNDFILPNGRPRFVGNYVFAAGTTLTNILETILRVSRSYQRLEDGKIALYGDDARASIFLMGANNIVPGSLSLNKKDLSKAPNVFIPKYRDIDIPAVARVIKAERVVPSFDPVAEVLFTLGSLSPFLSNDILTYGGAEDTSFNGAYKVGPPLVSVHGSDDGITDAPNQVRCGGQAGLPLVSTSGGFVGTNDARFSQRAPNNVVHRSAQKMIAMQAPGLAVQPKVRPVEYDMGNSTFDQTNRVMKFERDRTLGTDMAPPSPPVPPPTIAGIPDPPSGVYYAWSYPPAMVSSSDTGKASITSPTNGGLPAVSLEVKGVDAGITTHDRGAANALWGGSRLPYMPPGSTIVSMQIFAGISSDITQSNFFVGIPRISLPPGLLNGTFVGAFPFDPSNPNAALAAFSASAILAYSGDGAVFDDTLGIVIAIAVSFTLPSGYTGPIPPPTVAPPVPWKAPITGTLTGYDEAIDVNGNALADVNEHDIITLDDWVTAEFTGDYEVMERKITAPAGNSLGTIALTLHQYNRNAPTDVSDDPGGAYATVPDAANCNFGTFPLTNAAWVLQATPLATLNSGTGKLTVTMPDLSVQIMGKIAPTLYPGASWTGLTPGSPYVLYVDDPLGTGVGATFGFQAGSLPLTANPTGRYVILSGIFNPNAFATIDLSVGTATFFSGSGADSTNFNFPSTAGSLLANLIAWSSPRGHIDAGSNHLHFMTSSIDGSGKLSLIYNDSVGDNWRGPSNYAGITWSAGASARYFTIGVYQFVELTLAGGELVVFGQGLAGAGSAVTLPPGYSLAKSILLAFPSTIVDAGQPTLGVQSYVDATGHAFFKMDNGAGTQWQGSSQPFVFAWQNNMGTVTTSGGYTKIPLPTGKSLYVGGFSILDARRGGVTPANFPADSLTHILTGGKLPLPSGISGTSLQVIPGPNSFDATTPSNPSHGVFECLVDSSLNVKTSFDDGGAAHVWYGSSSVFALLYE